MAAGVVRVHTQIMAQAVREESDARPVLEDLILVALQDAHLQQPLDRNPVRGGMHLIPHHPRPQHAHADLLHPQHHAVELPTARAEAPPDRKRPRDVRGIAAKLAPGIQQQVLPAVQRLAVFLIVQRRGVGAGGDDGMVGLLPAAVGDAGLQEDGLELALVAGVAHGAQHGRVRERADGVGAAREGDFVAVFDDPALVDSWLEGCEVRRVEGEEGDVVGDLVWDGPDRGRPRRRLAAEGGVDFGGGEDGVDVIELEGFGRGEREAGPDDRVRVDGRDEEG